MAEPSHTECLPEIRFHLTARPWQPVGAPRSELVDQMDRAVHAMAPLQFWDESDPANPTNGAIIDPFDHKEIQYGTPLYAFSVATLLREGRCADLVESAAHAMDRATLDISDGPANDYHGEFFCAAMVKALRMLEAEKGNYPTILTPERIGTWKERMTTPRSRFFNMKVKQNWRTFAMKGEWLRQQDGYIADGVAWNEACWLEPSEGGQRERFRRDLDRYHLKPHWFFYHDDTADPETFAYNGATTANLLDSLLSGYDGASAQEMREIISHNLRSSLLILSGSGEAAAGGRTGEHTWDDSIYANAFQDMAELARRDGDLHFAGQLHHAVQLLLRSHGRFQQENGWFSITKNLFPPVLKNRYASWSGLANYENFTLTCCAETLLAQTHPIAEQPIPSEIGGYAMQLDPEFANVFLNAGGTGVQICTRGETDKYGWVQWHVLGITRFSRTGWDGRLGPGAGHVNPDFSDGMSFSPTFFEDGRWRRVCLEPKRFQGRFEPEFVHPLLVRGMYTIEPVVADGGPTFAMHLTVTPDGVLVDTECLSGAEEFGVVWPLLEFDGRTVLSTNVGTSVASTAYPQMSGAANEYQAETAKLSGDAQIVAENADKLAIHGEGFVRLASDGAAIEWTGLDGGDGGQTAIGFRYALALGQHDTRRARLLVNGIEQSELVFLSTGEERFWHQLYVPVTLAPGTDNTVRIECTGGAGVIVDELRVHPADAAMPEPDQQNFIALAGTHRLDASAPSVRGGYGDFRPVRVTDSDGGPVETFVYPRSHGDPDAETVRASFRRVGPDFSSVLGRVEGKLYIGRTAAGGVGKAIDLEHDGRDDVTFDRECAFVLQLRAGQVTAVEVDRPVKADIAGKRLDLNPFTPVVIR